jgi:histidinol phosphatase-like enzyme
MLFNAAAEHDISLENSWMIGDILNDVEAGNRAGCKTVLIDNGNETEWVERFTAHQLLPVKPLTKLPTGF